MVEEIAAEVEYKRRILRDDFQIQMTKTMEDILSDMCNLSKGIDENAFIKGYAIGWILSERQTSTHCIKLLMDTMGMSCEQSMAALKIPKEKWLKYIELLENPQYIEVLKQKYINWFEDHKELLRQEYGNLAGQPQYMERLEQKCVEWLEQL